MFPSGEIRKEQEKQINLEEILNLNPQDLSQRLKNLKLETLAQITQDFLSLIQSQDEQAVDLKKLKVILEKLKIFQNEWGRRQSTEIDFPNYKDLFLSLEYPDMPDDVKDELKELRKKQSSQPILSEEERVRLSELQAIEDLIRNQKIPYKIAELLMKNRQQIIELYDNLWKKQSKEPLNREEVELREFLDPFIKNLKQIVEAQKNAA